MTTPRFIFKRLLVLAAVTLSSPCVLSDEASTKKPNDDNERRLWSELDIAPMPKQIKLTGKTLPLGGKTKVVLVIGEKPCRQSEIGRDWINDRIREKGGTPLAVTNPAAIPPDAVAIVIGTKNDNALIAEAVGKVLDIGEKNPGERGYEIKIGDDGKKIYLGGADPLGTLYACVTFGELLEKGDGGPRWKEAIVRDWPDTITIFTLNGTFTTTDLDFPKIPMRKNLAEADKKTYLDGVKRFYDALLRRKLTGVHYSRMTLKGEKFVRAPWMDLVKEGIALGKERGIAALIYAEKPYPGLIGNYPELAKETDKLTRGARNRGEKWLIGWSFDEARRETARNLAEYVKATGFTHIGFHDTDAGAFDNPACWNFRGEFDKKRWGDDYAAATIHIHKIYYDELKKLNPEAHAVFTFYPYCIYIFDDKAFLNIREQSYGKSADSDKLVKAYQQRYADFWRRVGAAFPEDDVTFCVRESTWDSVAAWRKLIGDKRGICWWDAIGSKYWEPLFSQGPAWTVTFADNIRNIILVAYADQMETPLNILAVREYSWNRAAPGAVHFQPFYGKSIDSWEWGEAKGDIYSIVLPKLVRNLFGREAAPYIIQAMSRNIDANQALGRVRSSAFDSLGSPERRQWMADNAEAAAAAMNALWDKCRATNTQMGMDDDAYRAFVIAREALNTCAGYSKTRARLMAAEAFAANNALDKAKAALAEAKQAADTGAATMTRLIAERPETLKKTRLPIAIAKVMANSVDFAALSKEIAALDPDKIAANSAKNRLVIPSLAKKARGGGLLTKGQADIVIDGDPSEPIWNAAPAIDCFTVIREKKLAEAFTRAKIVRDADTLYLSCVAFAPPGKTVHPKDTVDVFLNVDNAADTGMVEFFITADGGFSTSLADKNATRHAVNARKDFWAGEIAIPLATIAKPGKSPATWTINLCRNCPAEGGPTEISSILPPEAANKRAKDQFPPLRFSAIPAEAPAATIDVKDFSVHTVTLPDRIASVASFRVAIASNMVLNKAVLSAETHAPNGAPRVRELATFDRVYLKEEPKTLYDAEFTETVEKGGVLLTLKSMEGTFTRWIRFGGWNNALFAPGIDGGQALAGECFFGGSDKILSPDSGTIEFYFKAKDGAVPAPALYQCFLGSGWQRKDQVSPAALRLAVFARDQKIGFSINNREQRRQSAMLSVSLPKDLDYRQWRHLACVLDGAADGDQVARVYLDGKRLFGSFKNEKASDAPKIGFYTAAPLTIQLGCAPGGRYESGFLMDEFRISRVARYRDNFTVDFKPWNIDDNTSALFHFDGSLEGTGPNGAKLTATPGIDGI